MNFEKMKETAIRELEQYRRFEYNESTEERQRAVLISAALHTLPEREQEILRQFFIDRESRYAGHRARLQGKYNLSLSELYRLKNQAITNYCMANLLIRAAANSDSIEEPRSTY